MFIDALKVVGPDMPYLLKRVHEYGEPFDEVFKSHTLSNNMIKAMKAVIDRCKARARNVWY